MLEDYNKYVGEPDIELNTILLEGLEEIKRKLP